MMISIARSFKLKMIITSLKKEHFPCGQANGWGHSVSQTQFQVVVCFFKKKYGFCSTRLNLLLRKLMAKIMHVYYALSSSNLRQTKPSLYQARILWLPLCWLLPHHRNRNRCWESVSSLSSNACIPTLLEKSQECCLRLITPSCCTCWSLLNPSKLR